MGGSDAGNSIGRNTVATVADNEGSRKISVAEANKIFYAEIAQGYDENEPCIADPEARSFARRLVSRAIGAAGKQDIRALDACGGSGYVSELLLEMGIQTLLVDISPEMLQRWRDKARARGHDPSIQEEEITEFLVRSEASWDLIVFSSALHHLDDYRRVVGLAVDSLAPGGVLLTMFDPVPAGHSGRLIRRIDWIAHYLLRDPAFVIRTARAKLRRASGGKKPRIGRLAERYATEGIDDRLLAQFLRDRGLEIVAHEREPRARLRPIRMILRLFGAPSTFHIVARRPGKHSRGPSRAIAQGDRSTSTR